MEDRRIKGEEIGKAMCVCHYDNELIYRFSLTLTLSFKNDALFNFEKLGC